MPTVSVAASEATRWAPLTVTDLNVTGAGPGECQYCGKQGLRFLHELIDEDSGERQTVGCECAARLCGAGYNGLDTENKLRNRYHRRSTWLSRQWHRSRMGNSVLRFKHDEKTYIVTIFPAKYCGFRYCISWSPREKPWFSWTTYGSPADAQLAAFDKLSERLDW